MNIYEKYTTIIKEAEKAQNIGDHKTINRIYKEKHRLRSEMLSNVDDYNSYFINRLENESSYIVLDASIALLKTNPELATKSLEKLSNQKGLDAFTAKITLEEWKKGNIN